MATYEHEGFTDSKCDGTIDRIEGSAFSIDERVNEWHETKGTDYVPLMTDAGHRKIYEKFTRLANAVVSRIKRFETLLYTVAGTGAFTTGALASVEDYGMAAGTALITTGMMACARQFGRELETFNQSRAVLEERLGGN